MSDFTEFYRDHIIEELREMQCYVGLLTELASEHDEGEEPRGNAYERQPIELTESDNGKSSNVEELRFPKAAFGWGLIAGSGLYDSLTRGNLIMSHHLEEPKVVATGDVFIFEPGEFKLEIR